MSKAESNLGNEVHKQQKEQIVELRNLLVYYKEITQTVREPFIILDKNLVVVTANRSFYRKFKVKKADTENKLIYELGNNQWDIPELRTLLDHILPKHRVMNNYRVSHDFPDLGHKTMLLNARQVDSKQLILLAIEDVTVQLKHKHDAEDTTAILLKQRNKLQELNDAKHDFIALASHQLRTPATAVKQYASMLTEGYAGDMSKKQMAMLAIVYKSNQRQLEIIEDLLRIAKIDDGKVYLEKSTSDIVKQIETAMRNQAILFKSRGQTIVFDKPKSPVTAFIDKKLMVMVLENLLDNAGKYSKNGKEVTIDVSQDMIYTSISIKDNGVGIGKRNHHKLFKKFSRIENPLSISAGGTGLGLYWAKKILYLHGGDLEMSSKLHKGSTFVVKVPVVAK